ncbi:TetR/AcrR family transcriptional regulator [Pelagibius sp.]|uniref:TetR/AcrR family transcriptional regulator n=1 Tax=Pelagibius sp. TaxID=1931238 RepID=UPI003B50FE9B
MQKSGARPVSEPENDTGAERSSRRAEILTLATALFLEKGYAGTSMSALARACGIQKASLYHHFPSKEALFVACVTDGYDVAVRKLQQILDDGGLDHEERLRRALTEIYRITIDSPVGRMSPLIAEVSRQIPEVAQAFHDGFIQQQHDIVNAILDAGEQAGAFVQHDRLGMVHLIFGPVVTLSISRQMFSELESLEARFPVDPVREGHCDLILQLLRPKG